MVRLGANSVSGRIWCTHPPQAGPLTFAADTFSRPNTKLLGSNTEVGDYPWIGQTDDDLDITADSEVQPLTALDIPFIELPSAVMTGDCYASVDIKFLSLGVSTWNGILFRAAAAPFGNDFLYFGIDHRDNGDLSLRAFRTGTQIFDYLGPGEYTPGQAYTLGVNMVGDQLTFYLDGGVIGGPITEAYNQTARNFGMRIQTSSADVRADNFLVREPL